MEPSFLFLLVLRYSDTANCISSIFSSTLPVIRLNQDEAFHCMRYQREPPVSRYPVSRHACNMAEHCSPQLLHTPSTRPRLTTLSRFRYFLFLLENTFVHILFKDCPENVVLASLNNALNSALTKLFEKPSWSSVVWKCSIIFHVLPICLVMCGCAMCI